MNDKQRIRDLMHRIKQREEYLDNHPDASSVNEERLELVEELKCLNKGSGENEGDS